MVGVSDYPQEQRYPEYRYSASDPQQPATIKAIKYGEPCHEPYGHDESDLCAQWRAAKATENSAFWAKWSFWVSIGGLVGLLATLHYTRKAVLAAEEATRGAEDALAIASRNAVAAEKSAEHAQYEAYLRLRAYMHAGTIEFGFNADTNAPKVVEIPFVNFGQTPAMRTGVMVSMRWIKSGEPISQNLSDIPAIDRRFGRSIVQNRHIVGHTNPISSSDLNAIASGQYRLIIIARIEYTDTISQEDHVTQECVELIIRGVGAPGNDGGRNISIMFKDHPEFYIAT
ncbi:hypothetical protein [Rhizorhabdus histidinilytica]|uniref:hypothetical protein n=1 Tax=Rhizorhabdus histidinilytica TaxID=439228 RepID=UPI00111659CC|nr:hypothetical protein [Rhizorhabdus histidinilytica]